MNPTSVPAIPAQPDQATYSPDSLALFKTFTRDTYLAAFGVQAPAWDASRAPKFWFDSTVDVSAPSNVAVYKVVDSSSGTPVLRQLVIPAAEAAAVNIPGAVTYALYVVAATNAYRTLLQGVKEPVSGTQLSPRVDAVALMQELGGSGLYEAGAEGPYPVTYPSGEERRMWTFMIGLPATKTTSAIGPNPFNAGELLAARNATGVGAPGRWDLSTGFPQWISAPPAPTGLNDTRPPVPMPVRDLLANEQLQSGPLGLGGALVVRTDLVQANSTGFTPDDRKLLQQIFAIVSK